MKEPMMTTAEMAERPQNIAVAILELPLITIYPKVEGKSLISYLAHQNESSSADQIAQVDNDCHRKAMENYQTGVG